MQTDQYQLIPDEAGLQWDEQAANSPWFVPFHFSYIVSRFNRQETATCRYWE